MRYLKILENYFKDEKDANNATIYLEEMVPISHEDGFIECAYVDNNDYFLVSFYFWDYTEIEDFEKFYEFLNDNDLQIYDNKHRNQVYLSSGNKRTVDEIIVKLTNDKVKEYAELYNTINNYNL